MENTMNNGSSSGNLVGIVAIIMLMGILGWLTGLLDWIFSPPKHTGTQGTTVGRPDTRQIDREDDNWDRDFHRPGVKDGYTDSTDPDRNKPYTEEEKRRAMGNLLDELRGKTRDKWPEGEEDENGNPIDPNKPNERRRK